MKSFRLAGFLLAMLAVPALADERIVFVRHGEKPEAGLGQLDCRGLNRALALPRVVARLFGKIDAVFAPDPSAHKPDRGVEYDYVRPLMTVEPTAIANSLPVQAHFGFADTKGLEAALSAPAYARATVLVGWEHKVIVSLARDLIAAHGGDAKTVPEWKDDDFDSIYVVTLPAVGPARFSLLREGLNGLPNVCRR